MRPNRTLEIGTGLFVLLGLAALIFLTTQLPSSGLKLSRTKPGYHVTAEFDDIGDLKPGAPVTLSGVTIGDVTGIRINPQNYRALVTLRIDPKFTDIPDDSDASIQTQGLLGGKYIAIGPGGSDMFLKNGGRITFTQSAIVLENLVNKLFANFAGSGSSPGSSGGAPAGGSSAAPGSGGSGAGKGGGSGAAGSGESGSGAASSSASAGPGSAHGHREPHAGTGRATGDEAAHVAGTPGTH
jgi:phospholipid/cholesterol/gamma-HCH transport system substrate-binding protein